MHYNHCRLERTKLCQVAKFMASVIPVILDQCPGQGDRCREFGYHAHLGAVRKTSAADSQRLDPQLGEGSHEAQGILWPGDAGPVNNLLTHGLKATLWDIKGFGKHPSIFSKEFPTGRTGLRQVFDRSLAPRIVPLQHDLKTFGSEDQQIRKAIFDAAPWRQLIIYLICVRFF